MNKFKVGDIVEYFRNDKECTKWDGSVGFVEEVILAERRAKVAWISCRGGLAEFSHLDYHVGLLRKIVLDAPPELVIDSDHAPKED